MSAASKPIERRMFPADISIRTNKDGSVGLRGYAAVFDSEAHNEVVRSSAFNTTLKQRDNVRLLVNHDGVPMASTKAGTMTLSIDQRGLLVDAPSLDMANPTVQELVSAMSRGDIDQMSFAFADLSPATKSNTGVRELTDVVLYDVSVVTYPWYEATTVGLTGDRDMDRALVCLRSLSPEQAREVTIIALDGDVQVSNVADNSIETETADCCDACGCDMPADANYCPDCGAAVPVSTMNACNNCGCECPTGAAYCPGCGVALTPAEPAADPTATPTPARGHSISEARALLGL
jgi:HK97 family phage prohead protease